MNLVAFCPCLQQAKKNHMFINRTSQSHSNSALLWCTIWFSIVPMLFMVALAPEHWRQIKRESQALLMMLEDSEHIWESFPGLWLLASSSRQQQLWSVCPPGSGGASAVSHNSLIGCHHCSSPPTSDGEPPQPWPFSHHYLLLSLTDRSVMIVTAD